MVSVARRLRIQLQHRPYALYLLLLLAASGVSVGLFLVAAWQNRSLAYAYLVWNLFLAWVPLVLSTWLLRVVRQQSWLNAGSLVLTWLWLMFLPNSFYMISDYIHLQEIQRADLLFDVVMFTAFIFVSLAVGFTSLLLVHRTLLSRVNRRSAHALVAVILLLCSYAIFLGRTLRWNTWDVILNPAGILFDVSDRFIHPGHHPAMFVTTLSFFVLLGTMYIVIWQGMRLVQRTNQPHLL